jgi:hypothetical protein
LGSSLFDNSLQGPNKRHTLVAGQDTDKELEILVYQDGVELLLKLG